MSRRSQAYAADGQPCFSWRVERIPTDSADTNRGRYKCVCRNHPSVVGYGDDEQHAIRAASAAMEVAVDSAKV